MTNKTNNHINIPTHRRVMPTIIFTHIKGVSPSPLLDVNVSVDHSKPEDAAHIYFYNAIWSKYNKFDKK